jgi:hypothetical protein
MSPAGPRAVNSGASTNFAAHEHALRDGAKEKNRYGS